MKVLEVTDLIYSIPNGGTIFDTLNFSLEENEFVGVLGKNGAGKTTLIDLIMGFRPFTSGSVKVFGENPLDNHRDFKSRITVVSNDIQLQRSISVREYLNFTSYFYPHYDRQMEQRLLKYFDIAENVKIGSLSTGQRVKTMVILALSARPELILMDEVTAVMDPHSRMYFLNLLKELKQETNCSVLFATNIAEDLKGVVDRVLFLDGSSLKNHQVADINYLFHNVDGEAA